MLFLLDKIRYEVEEKGRGKGKKRKRRQGLEAGQERKMGQEKQQKKEEEVGKLTFIPHHMNSVTQYVVRLSIRELELQF